MCAAELSLADLRREIDAVDDQMHALIMRRAELTLGVKAAKARANNHVYLRFGREAQILRRLAARHEGDFPLGAVVRMWRELLCAQIPVQGPFRIAVATTDDIGLWDSARDHYGSDTALTGYASVEAALDAVAEGRETLAVLPEPAVDGGWLHHFADRSDDLLIVVKLPFVAMERRDGPGTTAYVVSLAPPEESGDDLTLLAHRGHGDLGDALKAQGLKVSASWTWPGLAVAEVEGFLAADDSRAQAISDTLGAIILLGAYATPMTSANGTPT